MVRHHYNHKLCNHEIIGELRKSCLLAKLKVAGTECGAILSSMYSQTGKGRDDRVTINL